MKRARMTAFLQWMVAVLSIAAVTLLGRIVGLNATAMGFVFLVVVLLLSIWGGLALGLAMSILATACFNFFFMEPFYTFTLEDPANWIALSAFLVASVVVSRLVIRARRQAESAEVQRKEIETLYGLSVDLFTATSRVGPLGEAAGRALQLLGATAGGLILFEGSPNQQQTVWWKGSRGEEVEDIAAGVGRHQKPFEMPSPFGTDFYLPLAVGGVSSGVLVARGATASKEALESVARLVALAVERERLVEEHTHLEALREGDALKTSLLRAISHDLTTPLTSIAIRTEALKRWAAGNPDIAEDVAAVGDETSRLRRRIESLLAMARVEAGSVRPRPEPTPPGDLFRAVRENLPRVFESRPVVPRVEPDCPDVYVDPSIALEVLVNFVENADRVSPPGAPLELTARRHPIEHGWIRLEVLDRGPGVGALDGGVTLSSTDLPRRGLGLEIARSLAGASGGSIGLANREGGGAVARLDLPAAPVAVEKSES
jgi:two-component system, OmpR family, sensor histidine kinase KdpD